VGRRSGFGKLATVRRPPELLTRDVVAKAINSEVKAGRGSPHGGAFLDISHRGEEAILKKLPRCTTNSRNLLAWTSAKEPMEVGPTAHYVMGGVRVNAETQESTVPGLYACGEVASGLHGANRLVATPFPTSSCFGKRAGEHLQPSEPTHWLSLALTTLKFNRHHRNARSTQREGGENPGLIYDEMRDMMQAKVGIIRTKEEMTEAMDDLASVQ